MLKERFQYENSLHHYPNNHNNSHHNRYNYQFLNMIKKLSKQTHNQHYPSKTGFHFPTIRYSYYIQVQKSRHLYIQACNKLIVLLTYQMHHRKLNQGCIIQHDSCYISYVIHRWYPFSQLSEKVLRKGGNCPENWEIFAVVHFFLISA